MSRVEERSNELVGRVCSMACIIDGTREELAESETSLDCGRVEYEGADALANVSQGALS